MDDLSNDIFKDEKKGVARLFRKLPKKVRIVIFILSFVITYAGGIISRPLFDRVYVNFVKQDHNSGVQIGKVEGTNTINFGTNSNCPFKFCSNFKDEKWMNMDRFTIVQDNPMVLKSPNTSALPGATLFFNEDVGNFTMLTFLTPLSSPSPNMVVAYGHFLRCIIGDGDYSKISCQINVDYPKAIENWSYLNSEGKLHGKNLRYQISPFTKDNELQIKFSILKVNDNKQVEIKLNDQVPLTWLLPKEFENRIQKEKVGVGLFTAGQDDVEAVFKEFMLDTRI